MTKHPFSLTKAERLCSKATIERLFNRGNASMAYFPLRAVYRKAEREDGPAVQVLFSVSKRRFKHAVDRNRAKRQMREAYRKAKHTLLDALPEGERLDLAFLWLSDKPVDSAKVEQRLCAALERIAEKEGRKEKATCESSEQSSDAGQ